MQEASASTSSTWWGDKDCGTGRKFILPLSFNSRGILEKKKKPHTQKGKKKAADQEIKFPGISDHMKNAEFWLNTLIFSLALISYMINLVMIFGYNTMITEVCSEEKVMTELKKGGPIAETLHSKPTSGNLSLEPSCSGCETSNATKCSSLPMKEVFYTQNPG